MAIERLDHVGIVVSDLSAATAFFTDLGLKPVGEATVRGAWVDRIVGLDGVESDIAMLEMPDGHGCLELTQFRSPASPKGDSRAPANAPGLRHITFRVDDVDAAVARAQAGGAELVGTVEQFETSYRLCYIRGPEGIIVELAEQIG